MSGPSMAVVTTCYDRWEFLAETLPTWEALAGAPPVFVGAHADDALPACAERVHLVAAHDPGPFHLSRLRNAAALAARDSVDPELLLFVDADIAIQDADVFRRHFGRDAEDPDVLLDAPAAVSTEHEVLRDDPEHESAGKRGTALVRTSLFFEAGGYDQRMIRWGWEDRNLYVRLDELGAKIAYYDRSQLEHRDHPDELRHEHRGGRGHIHENLFIHLRSYDARGASWQEELGYPEVTVRPPLRTGIGEPSR